MAIEPKRGCGYRKVGGLYLVGEGLTIACDRLPMSVQACPVCGCEPRFARTPAKINPAKLFGNHQNCNAGQMNFSCPICEPGISAWLMWIGREYTEQSFIAEAMLLGVSKRIPFVPNELEIGKDWVWLAMQHIIPGTGQFRLPGRDDEKRKKYGYGPGIFYAFRPVRIEKVITQRQADLGEAEQLRKQNITPVIVPTDDPDHNPVRASKRERDI